ncbi:hypothetical protein FHR95_001660 [Halomonas fontilapidosi]|uniref:DUF262 domain-containing protein n=1 Tax=Halomonas fontilapidosi TaxID=616675 RepID=A0A7W5GYY8_9GAMM|nr:DUF262 domain-containing protein [Halomonas fontilapidosi]MBB3184100.1 hypothetical protein [Halomonas fontilapidosi]
MNLKNDGISQLSVQDLLGAGKLNTSANYLIPMYQRNYAWGEGEITQLIQDVLDEMLKPSAFSEQSNPYYIGTLVVFNKNSETEQPLYEVIDGQQRLTTLFLLASFFRNKMSIDGESLASWFQHPSVRFENRPRSSKSLDAIFHGYAENSDTESLHTKDYNRDILNGYELIQRLVPKLCKDNGSYQKDFSDYLFHCVQIMRVQVPADTDLNHYFEVMNNRGEQLEKHEVLKSKMMSTLEKADYAVLQSVWEACSNMERYVQMGFTRTQRDRLFGQQDWGVLKPSNYSELQGMLAEDIFQDDTTQALPLSHLICKPPSAKDQKIDKQNQGERSEETPERFNSVINFPNFLLQVLRVTTGQDIPLDDKRLITSFQTHLLSSADAAERVRRFTYNLLKCKLLLDHYVIKREYTGNTDDWSLKRLKWQASNGSSDYVNTFGAEDSDSDTNRRVLMLLSALHVSTPTMVYKHWLSAALHFLFRSEKVEAQPYLCHLESVSRCFVYDRFLAYGDGAEYYDIIFRREGKLSSRRWSDIDEKKLRFGNIENNFVFNYLDYLLWCKYYRNNPGLRKYSFSFRSSVEHYYPQNPMPGIDKLDQDIVNSFGNLCLISHSKNSRLSNFSPKSKEEYYSKGEIDSIKQWLMMNANTPWEAGEIQQHNDEMIEVFKRDLESGLNPICNHNIRM